MSRQDSDFTQGSILKKLTKFMLPILAALILQAAYGAVDLLVVGHFGSTEGLSAVSTGSQILNVFTFVVTSLAMGITVLIARYIGEGNNQQIGKLIGGSTIVFTIISIFCMLIMVIFASSLSTLMQAPSEALDLTISYVRICGGGFLFIVAYNVLSSIFRGLGDSKSPLMFVGVACVVNIFGDLLFVAVLKMDAAGAAIATVLAQTISVLFALYSLNRKTLPFNISKEDFKINEECAKFLKIGLPLALQEFLTQISFLALCAFINKLGLVASSGYGVAGKVVSFVMLIPSALMQSMASFVSQNVGAKKEDRAKQALYTGILVGGSIGLVVCIFIFFKGDLLTALFTSDTQVIEKGFDYLRGFCLEAIVTAILFSLIGYFNGHNETIWVMIQGLSQTLLVRLPVAYIMSIQENASLTNIGLSAPIATIFGIIINLIYLAYFNKKKLNVKN